PLGRFKAIYSLSLTAMVLKTDTITGLSIPQKKLHYKLYPIRTIQSILMFHFHQKELIKITRRNF
ncbi:MAG: hypothetical protein ACPGXZ_17560, partial [Saprospiraceae bacterium]